MIIRDIKTGNGLKFSWPKTNNGNQSFLSEKLITFIRKILQVEVINVKRTSTKKTFTKQNLCHKEQLNKQQKDDFEPKGTINDYVNLDILIEKDTPDKIKKSVINAITFSKECNFTTKITIEHMRKEINRVCDFEFNISFESAPSSNSVADTGFNGIFIIVKAPGQEHIYEEIKGVAEKQPIYAKNVKVRKDNENRAHVLTKLRIFIKKIICIKPSEVQLNESKKNFIRPPSYNSQKLNKQQEGDLKSKVTINNNSKLVISEDKTYHEIPSATRDRRLSLLVLIRQPTNSQTLISFNPKIDLEIRRFIFNNVKNSNIISNSTIINLMNVIRRDYGIPINIKIEDLAACDANVAIVSKYCPEISTFLSITPGDSLAQWG